MTTTFEDRLLTELREEVGRVAPDAPVPARSRLLTVPRVGLAAGVACAATAATMVALPGAGTSSAYAVEYRPDGKVVVTLRDLTMDQDEQQSLADELRDAGITVGIENHPSGLVCAPLGEHVSTAAMQPLRVEDGNGDLVEEMTAIRSVVEASGHPDSLPSFTMLPGDTLVIENTSYRRVDEYVQYQFVEGEARPCELVPIDDGRMGADDGGE
ncbi:hypothetical protein [Streptomyces sp. B6B3]|uniref:hypothetical protein n=1 Tax=Streptomyces sp. B6B3 TaxID=3153570 RepID=UPI00325CD5C4